jgi:preprotein translocase subunit SecF
VANLFTAVFVSRAIFDLQLWRNPRLEKLSIGGSTGEIASGTRIDFLSRRTLTLGLSLLAIVISVGSLIWKGGPRYGLDFRGGTLVYVRFDPKPPIDDLRNLLSARFTDELSVQETQGSGEFIIGAGQNTETSLEQTREAVRSALSEKYAAVGSKLDLNNASRAALEDRLRAALPKAGVNFSEQELQQLVTKILNYRDQVKNGVISSVDELDGVAGSAPILTAIKNECGAGTFNLRSAEQVGPRAGRQMREQALYATLGALAGMLAYIAYRFQWISGTAAVLATVHDVVITLGLFALTDREINLNIIAALLTLIGYSMNDKIVVFDRVRENRTKMRGASLRELVNVSINQTLSRTLLTAGPTLLACMALYFLGGEVLNGIAFALFAGIVVGTYSSIFVASALLVIWEERRKRPADLAAREAQRVSLAKVGGAPPNRTTA